MELYYENLISERSSVEKLVDDLMCIVQGADEMIQAADANNWEPAREREISDRLARLKEACLRLKQRASACADAADKIVRQNPYASIGLACAIGVMIGAAISRKRD
jgi:ElaB/YqjD/DUF883 family membrane-anchored ribosome-binding protein